jgi:hypothetical protein
MSLVIRVTAAVACAAVALASSADAALGST